MDFDHSEVYNMCAENPNALKCPYSSSVDVAVVCLKVMLNVFCVCVCVCAVLCYHVCMCLLVCVCALCGQNARRVISESTAVRPVSVRTEPGVTTSPGDAAAPPVGPESAAN